MNIDIQLKKADTIFNDANANFLVHKTYQTTDVTQCDAVGILVYMLQPEPW